MEWLTVTIVVHLWAKTWIGVGKHRPKHFTQKTSQWSVWSGNLKKNAMWWCTSTYTATVARKTFLCTAITSQNIHTRHECSLTFCPKFATTLASKIQGSQTTWAKSLLRESLCGANCRYRMFSLWRLLSAELTRASKKISIFKQMN